MASTPTRSRKKAAPKKKRGPQKKSPASLATQRRDEARRKRIAVAKALRIVSLYKKQYPLLRFRPYSWQEEFFAAGAKYPYRMLMAANRIGKTFAAGAEISFHATGEYPDWWQGLRFEHPPLIWALGVSGEQLRDVIQSLLFGVYDGRSFGGGLITKNQIRDSIGAVGTPRLIKDAQIHHKEGISTISLKSYSQGQHPLMGSSIDLAWIDEEPQDESIYPQVLTRTATGNQGKGGSVLITETPELGMTQLVKSFMDDRGQSQYLQNVTWDDAPHLDEQTRQNLLESIPKYQREMRSRGIPVLGEGMIYAVAEERLSIDPIPIPDHWFRCAAIDFGIDHPTACVWVAEDRDSDIIYVYDVYRQPGETPPVHAAAIRSRGDWPVIYPHDGDNTEKGSGKTLAQVYAESGLRLHAKFTNPDGSNFVEPGIMDITARMREGRLKIFKTCSDWFQEYRRYHRKNGKIVKIDDDLMDATRYAVISVGRFGKQYSETRTIPLNTPRHKLNQSSRGRL